MRRLVLGALAVLCAAGCGPRQATPPGPAVPLAPLPRREDLLRSLSERRAAVQSLRTLARTTVTTDGDSYRARELIIAARPDRLRFEVLSPFGSEFVVATSDGLLAAYERGEATFYRGTASAENLARYARVALPVETAVDLLLGTPPVGAGGLGVVSREEGLVKLWQEGGRTVHVTWFGDALDPVRYEQRDREGRVLLRASFGDYAPVQGVSLPTRIELDLPWSGQRIDIDLRDPELNPPLSDTVFALATPPGSRVVDLDRMTP
jgi:outer membrane lipoprotein-sorting protein